VRALAGAALAAVLVTPAAQGQDAPVEIDFWSWVPGISTQVDEFNASQDAIHVNHAFSAGSGEEYPALKTALETNTGVPDAVQIEFQHLPSFIVRGELADLTAYGANDVAELFVPWTIAQVSQGEGIYAYPQDAGPMIMMCNTALLDAAGVAVPTTWDEVVTASAAFHEANPDAYLMNFTPDQGHFFGLLWQSGAKPFVVDMAAGTIAIDFTSAEVTRVAQLWDDLMDSGNLSPLDTYSADWNAALAANQIACWTAGAWGPSLIESNATGASGDWRVLPMPQWDAANPINGNYGGSTIAVTAASDNPAEAEVFARWLNSDAKVTLDLTGPPANLFPVTQSTLADAAWTDFAPEFWGGEPTHQVMADGAQQVDTSFAWSPFTDYVYNTYGTLLADVRAGTTPFVDALASLDEQASTFAADQGFTVTE
jgi:multiple sugar transport system substrate-binding protein